MPRKGYLHLTIILLVLALAGTAVADQDLPDSKKTTLGLYADSRQAYTMWRNDPVQVAIIDCRTPEEYVYVGHAAMAVNIPSKLMTHEFDTQKKSYKMVENPDFVAAVKKLFKKEQTLLIMCRSGSRSARSVDMLAQAGYTNVYSITDGFEGDKVKDENSYFNGQRMVNGWKNSGNPWTYACDPSLVYAPQK